MVTIKDVAALSKTSISTASIVLRGDGDERKISKATQNQVLQAARALGYRPNISARRLRGQTGHDRLSIAVFWADDFRLPMFARFMRGLQRAVQDEKIQVDFSFLLYHNDELSKHTAVKHATMFNAIIICNASQIDMAYLEETEFPVPIVLYNRHSARHCTVNVNDQRMGALPAQIFARLGHRSAAIMTSDSAFPGMGTRDRAFLDAARAFHMETHTLKTENSMLGGFNAAKEFCALTPRPDCLFCVSDSLAIGALRYFNMQGIFIPEDLELISIGNGDPEQEQYTVPALSVIHLPMEDMAQACFKNVLLSMRSLSVPASVELPVCYIPRESCRAAPDESELPGSYLGEFPK